MTKAWMVGAELLAGVSARTPPGVGAPRAVWTVTDTSPEVHSAREEAERLIRNCRSPHLVWNPRTGDVVQTLPATRRSPASLGSTDRYAQHFDHGWEGRVCLVVAVVARTVPPFTEGPVLGLTEILDWLDSWGVPRQWPAGQPGSTPGAGQPGSTPGKVEAAVRAWSRGGHFGHDQVPGSTAPGPGAIDIGRLTGPFQEAPPRTSRPSAMPSLLTGR